MDGFAFLRMQAEDVAAACADLNAQLQSNLQHTQRNAYAVQQKLTGAQRARVAFADDGWGSRHLFRLFRPWLLSSRRP